MALPDLVERLSILLRAELRQAASSMGLAPVQVETLRYLAACNRFSDTPAAVAEYLGATPGTVSQTIATLARKGLLMKIPDDADGRRVHCVPTAAGLSVASDVGRVHVPPDVGRDAESALRALLVALQRERGGRTFGVCATCRFHRRLAGGDRCGLTGEPLSDEDGTRICREHAPAM